MDTEKIERMFEKALIEQVKRDNEKYPMPNTESMSDEEAWRYYTKRGTEVYG